MAEKRPSAASGPTLGGLADRWRRALLAENKSAKTLMTYLDAVTTFEAYVRSRKLPTAADRIAKTLCLDFVADQLVRFKPATASVRYRALQSFYPLGGRRARTRGQPDGDDATAARPRDAPGRVLGR